MYRSINIIKLSIQLLINRNINCLLEENIKIKFIRVIV